MQHTERTAANERSSARGQSDEVCAAKRNRETGAESETYKDRVWFNLLTKPWNGIGVIRESKNISVPACPPLSLPVTLKAQTLNRKKKKTATGSTFLHLVGLNSLHCSWGFIGWILSAFSHFQLEAMLNTLEKSAKNMPFPGCLAAK